MSGLIHPGVADRVAIVGATGTGKTQMAAWILSEAPFDRQPYTIINYKGDRLLGEIHRAKEIGFNEVPKKPGLYILNPRPETDDDAMENWLWKVWGQEDHGLFFDEGYMIPDRGAFSAILTQGRSKQIPAIIGSQRPVWLNRFVWSEAQFYSVFRLQTKKDRLKVGEYIPEHGIPETLPKYHSIWYDVNEHRLLKLKPVPSAEDILDRFDDRLKSRRNYW